MFEAAGITSIVVVGDVPGGIPGGTRRRDSVERGLDALPSDVEWVLVHDAARPLVPIDLVERLLERLAVGDVDGVVPAVPLVDTVKRVDGETVVATVDRSTLVSVQTPQEVWRGIITELHSGILMKHGHTTGLIMMESIIGDMAMGDTGHLLGNVRSLHVKIRCTGFERCQFD